MKSISVVIILAFLVCSCNAVSNSTIETAPSASTMTATLSPTSPPLKTPTITQSPVPEITLTPLPNPVLNDILKTTNADITVNQYGWYVEGFTYAVSVSSDSDCVHSGQYGLQIKPPTADTRGSWWAIDYFPPLDTPNIKYLNFWIKGETGGEVVFIYMSTQYGAETGFHSDEYVETSPTEWRQVKILLNDSGGINLSFLSFTLEQDNNAKSVCIDDISFTP